MNDYLDDPANKPAISEPNIDTTFQEMAGRIRRAQREFTAEAFLKQLPRLLFIEFLNAQGKLRTRAAMELAANSVGELPACRRVLAQLDVKLSDVLPFAKLFDSYQQAALRTAPVEKGVFGLLDIGAYNLWEAGEIGNIIKKVLHHGHDLDSVDKDDKKGRTYRQRIVDESGDLLWALAIVLHAVGAKMSEASDGNINKLSKRYPAGFSIEASINRTE